MSRHERLTVSRAQIRAADNRLAREVLIQLTYLGVNPDAVDRAFEQAKQVIWGEKHQRPLITRRPRPADDGPVRTAYSRSYGGYRP